MWRGCRVHPRACVNRSKRSESLRATYSLRPVLQCACSDIFRRSRARRFGSAQAPPHPAVSRDSGCVPVDYGGPVRLQLGGCDGIHYRGRLYDLPAIAEQAAELFKEEAGIGVLVSGLGSSAGIEPSRPVPPRLRRPRAGSMPRSPSSASPRCRWPMTASR